MAHEDAKQKLARAVTQRQLSEAVRQALRDGMPLAEIEAFLDHLEATRDRPPGGPQEPQ